MAKEAGKFCVVLVTAPKADVASKIARGLVKRKLAACVSELPGITSHFFWEGELQKDAEVLLIAKTRSSLVPDIVGFVRENHPAEVPEVISLPIMDGFKEYLEWVGANTLLTKPEEEIRFPL